MANVTAPATCPWFTKTTVPWVSVSSGGSGTGNGTVSYSVDPNASAPRFGSLSIAGKTLTISQSDSNGVLPKSFPPSDYKPVKARLAQPSPSGRGRRG